MNIRTDILRKILRVSGMAFAMLVVLIAFSGIFWGSRHLIVKHHVVFYEDLPQQFDGYRILHFSDLHTGTLRGGREDFLDRLIDSINAQNCDAVVFTGDIVNEESAELAGLRKAFRRIKAPDGVYSILGNHDYATYSSMNAAQQKSDIERLLLFEEGYGWKTLVDDHVRLRRGSQSLVIAGVGCYGTPPFPQRGDLVKALDGVKRNDFVVLLSHDPAHWRLEVVPNSSVQLTLSGHTHAGQFLVWGWSPVKWRCDEWSGLYKEGQQVLYVSDGVGERIVPFRYGAWPEISVITLRKIPKNK